MNGGTSLAIMSRASQMLAEATTVQKAKELKDLALTAQDWARRKGMGEEAILHCRSYALYAERRMGEMLAATESQRAKGGEQYHGEPTGTAMIPVVVTLAEMGLTKYESARAQRVAEIPAPLFQAVVSGKKTVAAALRETRQAGVIRQEESVKMATVKSLQELLESGQTFGTVYADPPWAYGNQSTRAATDNHYRTMPLADICALPIGQLAAEKSHCHLWTTNGFLRDAFAVLDAWGFTYKSCFVWVKPEMGIGNYWRVSHEFMLLGVRGDLTFADKGLKSWIQDSRRKHSAKPEIVRDFIEKASPGPWLELFARNQAKGWTSWGDQVAQNLFTENTE